MRERVRQEQPAPATAAVPHLTYFDARGRAEVIRLLLAETATPYTERRISGNHWPATKRNFIYGQLPVYEEGQADVICRYLGRKHVLYGDSVFDHGRCDIVQQALSIAQADLFELFWNPLFPRLRDPYEQQHLPPMLNKLQKLFLANTADSGYWVGERLSFVDLQAWYFLDCVRPLAPRALAACTELCRFKARLEHRPCLAAYLRSDRRPTILTAPNAPFGGTQETS